MEKRVLERREYLEYILISNGESGNGSVFREPGEFLRYMMQRELSSASEMGTDSALAEAGNFLRFLESTEAYLSEAKEILGHAEFLMNSENVLLSSLPSEEPGNRDRLEEVIFESKKFASNLDETGERFGILSTEIFGVAGETEDRITSLSLLLESKRREALEKFEKLLPISRYEIGDRAPKPEEIFGEDYLIAKGELSAIDETRGRLLSALNVLNRRAGVFCRISVYITGTARVAFPQVLGRMAIAAGLAGLDKDGSYEFERADAIATLTSLLFKLKVELDSLK